MGWRSELVGTDFINYALDWNFKLTCESNSIHGVRELGNVGNMWIHFEIMKQSQPWHLIGRQVNELVINLKKHRSYTAAQTKSVPYVISSILS